MHRILLYALVVALLYLAWDARRGEILAAGKGFGQTGSGVLLAKAEIDRQGQTGAAPGLYRNASEKRLEARVESMPDAWSQFDLQAEPGPPPEVVLADAEKWMETKFPEGGRTSETAAEEPSATSESGKANGNSEVRGRAATGQSDAAVKSQESSPVYIASLARIECINGDLPAWVGLLDLALRPNA